MRRRYSRSRLRPQKFGPGVRRRRRRSRRRAGLGRAPSPGRIGYRL